MKNNQKLSIALLFALCLIMAYALPAFSQGGEPEANLIDSCVPEGEYDPDVNYFPEQTTIEYSAGFTVEYFNNYKVVTVLNPWLGAEQPAQYVLVQCGTPAPEDDTYTDAEVIEVPVESIVTMSTTYLPHLESLDLLDRLVGHDTFAYVYSPAVRELIDAEALTEVGTGPDVNIEVLLDLEPSLIMTYASGIADIDAYPLLVDAGLMVALNADFLDTSTLGQAEWLKFIATFFNREADANAIFDERAEQYEALVALVAETEERPTVLVGSEFFGAWYVSGGASYAANLLADAGTDYLWADDESTGGIPLDFEVILDEASDADFWVNLNQPWLSIEDALTADERYEVFVALENGNAYNNNARVSEFGGNDFFESAGANPHLVLADLVAIFHPELMPDHELVYYQQLIPADS